MIPVTKEIATFMDTKLYLFLLHIFTVFSIPTKKMKSQRRQQLFAAGFDSIAAEKSMNGVF